MPAVYLDGDPYSGRDKERERRREETHTKNVLGGDDLVLLDFLKHSQNIHQTTEEETLIYAKLVFQTARVREGRHFVFAVEKS